MRPDCQGIFSGTTIFFPLPLWEGIEEEHRPALEMLRDAVEGYRKEQRWRRTLGYGADRAKTLGITEANVPRLIAAYRREQRQGLCSE